MNPLGKLKRNAKRLKAQVYVLYFATRHPGAPWHAKLVVFAVVAYALSPIDLIPDFIPVLGQLDDLILLPLGIALAVRFIPKDVIQECTEKTMEFKTDSAGSWKAAMVIIFIWIATALVLGRWLWSMVVV